MAAGELRGNCGHVTALDALPSQEWKPSDPWMCLGRHPCCSSWLDISRSRSASETIAWPAGLHERNFLYIWREVDGPAESNMLVYLGSWPHNRSFAAIDCYVKLALEHTLASNYLCASVELSRILSIRLCQRLIGYAGHHIEPHRAMISVLSTL